MFIKYIWKLRTQAARFEAESEAATDKFNKGYFDGKAEQCHKLADALEANDPDEIAAD